MKNHNIQQTQIVSTIDQYKGWIKSHHYINMGGYPPDFNSYFK